VWMYPAKYCDSHGEVTTAIVNDGHLLRMELRGVIFAGQDFESFEPLAWESPEALSSFAITKYGDTKLLGRYFLETEIKVVVVVGETTVEATFTVSIGMKDTLVGKTGFRLALNLEDKSYRSIGKSGCFEEELLDIQRQLPDCTYMRICFSCAYSDYSPAGNRMFGCMMCFRNKKQEYLKVKTKRDFWSLGQPAEWVQETYLCSEFERRMPGTGYRG
jgi:hypothetical protein